MNALDSVGPSINVWLSSSIGASFLERSLRGKQSNGKADIKEAAPNTRKPSHQAPIHLGSFGVISTAADRDRSVSYCKFENLREDFIFAKLRICNMRSFVEINPSQNSKITLSFSWPSRARKKSVGIFEYILASMLNVYLDVF